MTEITAPITITKTVITAPVGAGLPGPKGNTGERGVIGPQGQPGEMFLNMDGGAPDSNYGGMEQIDGGGV